jgi:hypothetical protein
MKQSEERLRLDFKRGRAAQFFSKNYSREKRYLIILSRDLAKEFRAIQENECAKEFQFYYDFLCDFERLKELMKEFRWSSEDLEKAGIRFKEYRKLYFSMS